MSDEKNETEERLNAARARVGPRRRLYVASSPAGDLILGAPRAVDYAAYRALLFSEDTSDKAKAANVLLIACAVDPDSAGMRTLLDDYVALAGAPEVASAIAKAIGTAKADEEKK